MERLKKYVAGKNVIISFILTYAVYAIMLLHTIPTLLIYSKGITLPDMMPLGYNAEHIYNLLTELGVEGRAYYLAYQLPIDFIYPLLFALSGYLSLVYFQHKLHLKNTIWSILVFLPVIAGAADYLENIGIISFLNSFPEIPVGTVNLNSAISIVKSMATTLYFVLLLIMVGKSIINFFKKA